MRGSLKLATVFGIPVFVHWSFSLLLLFILYTGWTHHIDAGGFAFLFLFIFSLFLCVILHEYGHALSARYYGVQTRDITILPIGGVARLDKLPRQPFQEFIVAIAGPAVNVVIFSIIYLLLYVFFSLHYTLYELITSETDEIVVGHKVSFLLSLLQANLFLVLFNMIPAFPMDGGRVLRAWLSSVLGRVRATRIAAIIGQIISIGFVVFGVMNEQPVMALIGVFIFFAAANENRSVKMEDVMTRHTVSNIYNTGTEKLQTSTLIGDAQISLKQKNCAGFIVFDGDNQLRGIIEDDDIKGAVTNKDYENHVSVYMRPNFFTTRLDESIKDLYNRMQSSRQYFVPVMSNNEIVGTVDINALDAFSKKNSKYFPWQ